MCLYHVSKASKTLVRNVWLNKGMGICFCLSVL